jgi:hypothetical protein
VCGTDSIIAQVVALLYLQAIRQSRDATGVKLQMLLLQVLDRPVAVAAVLATFFC